MTRRLLRLALAVGSCLVALPMACGYLIALAEMILEARRPWPR